MGARLHITRLAREYYCCTKALYDRRDAKVFSFSFCLTPQRKHRKMPKDDTSEVWPESVEKIFVDGAMVPSPSLGRLIFTCASPQGFGNTGSHLLPIPGVVGACDQSTNWLLEAKSFSRRTVYLLMDPVFPA